MNQRPMRLTIFALLLMVISVCLTILGVLTLATAQADFRLAERYAAMTAAQYSREAAGQAFLRDADRALQAGVPLEQLEGVTCVGDVYEKEITEEGFTLHIVLRLTEDGGYELVRWETDTQWSPEELTYDLWGG